MQNQKQSLVMKKKTYRSQQFTESVQLLFYVGLYKAHALYFSLSFGSIDSLCFQTVDLSFTMQTTIYYNGDMCFLNECE